MFDEGLFNIDKKRTVRMKITPSIKKVSHILHFLLLFCLCLPLLTGCESRRIIVNSLEERDANEILVFLSSKGVDAVKVQNAGAGGAGGGNKVVLWDISVDSNQALEAMAYLNQAGLPRRRSQNLLNIFTGAGLVPSEMEQKIRYQAGLAEQIASTIRKMDGILDAEVQISTPEEDPLNPTQKKQPITASVFVKHNGILDDPNSHLVSKIKRLVAAGVHNLDPDNVTVVGERARYNDLPVEFNPASNEESKQYVSVWTLTIAKDSLTRFQLIFFSFVSVILVYSIVLIWLGWKTYPLIKAQGGLKTLLHIKPLFVDPNAVPKPEDKKEDGKETEKGDKKDENKESKGEDGESLANKDVDQT